MKKVIYRLASLFFLFFLLINPKLSIEGAKTGLLFWFNILVPTLLPFLIGSNLILSLQAQKYITFFLEKPLRWFAHLSESGCYTFFIGLLCGYPMGAKTCNDLLTNGQLEKKEAEYLLSFCNHASPMFLCGFVMFILPVSHSRLFLLAYYLPILFFMFIGKYVYGIKRPVKMSHHHAEKTNLTFNLLDQSIHNALETILKIGGHIIFFSILESWFLLLPISQPLVKTLLLAGTEMTTGIVSIHQFYPASTLGEILALAACAFGGLSGISQSKAVLKNSQLSIVPYITGKIIHSLLAVFFFLIGLSVL
ncbi:membrane protein [Clostridia bacterium]|nr:membrane protein [Clostridia bacterium]